MPLLLLFALALPVYAQEFVPEHVVFPITDFKPDITHLAAFSMKFGTGFCLDRDCRFVGTNYHVAKVMGKYVRIKGVFSAHRYLDSEPDDAGAQDVALSWGGSLKYTPAHDLAIYEMRHPVKGFHGIGFDADDLENSYEADIYAYPLDWNPKRRLLRWHGKFIGKTGQGLLAFSYEEGRVRGGASGGIVVDSKTKKIVGILSGMARGRTASRSRCLLRSCRISSQRRSPTCKRRFFRRPFSCLRWLQICIRHMSGTVPKIFRSAPSSPPR